MSDQLSQPQTDAQIANRYTLIGLFINGFLLLGTVVALGFSWWSSHISDETLRHVITQDSISDEQNRQKEIIERKEKQEVYNRDTATYNLSKRSVDAQITELKETQNQFRITNRPFLEAQDFKFVITNGKPVINFTITDLGLYPAKMTDSKVAIYLATAPRNIDSLLRFKGLKRFNLNAYVLHGGSKSVNNTSFGTMSPEIEKAFHERQFSIFIAGDIKYLDEMTKHTRTYRFHVELLYGEPLEWKVWFNKNF